MSVTQINWQTAADADWALRCDFRTSAFQSKRVSGDRCGLTCVATRGCTHFTWTDFEGGTCWMKSGTVRKEDAHPTESNSNVVCGIVKLCKKL
jgi:hypothetical protein